MADSIEVRYQPWGQYEVTERRGDRAAMVILPARTVQQELVRRRPIEDEPLPPDGGYMLEFAKIIAREGLDMIWANPGRYENPGHG